MLNCVRFFSTVRPTIMQPLIAVVGATGTGKSKLAVDLASRFNGEIINGDAMQLYRGLPIITNQIPIEERNGIPHHLISCVELDEETWRIGIFKREALRLIKEIHSRGKLPILVGGTHYYTQAVLFKDQTIGDRLDASDEDPDVPEESGSAKSTSDDWPILNASPEEILQKLKEVDPVMAARWHPKETRKIRRSLEIYYKTGRPASELYAEQKRRRQEAIVKSNDESGGSPLRFPTIVFWVHAEKDVLNSRLNDRVDAMVDQGLMCEAKRMSDHVREKQSQGLTIDQTKGVWVSIGFKELAPYFSALYEGSSSEEELETLKRSCIESVKTATRQYAVYQVKWIRNKLWKSLAEAGLNDKLYLLDSTNVADWDKCITEPSERVVNSFFNNEPCPDPKSLSELARATFEARERQEMQSLKDTDGMPQCITCEICRKTMTNEEQWNIHINGSVHKRALKSAARRAERNEYLRKMESLKNNLENKPNEE